MTTTHHCHAIACETPIPPRMHMCLKHWCMVPKLVQDLIWHHYRTGQEIDKNPSIEYLAMAFASISCVAMKEGKTLPTFAENKTQPQVGMTFRFDFEGIVYGATVIEVGENGDVVYVVDGYEASDTMTLEQFCEVTSVR